MYYGERLNSISHLVGAALALVGFGVLLTLGVQSRDVWLFTSFSVFGFTLVLLYTASTLYHSFHPPRLKRLFRVLDHISIYLLIAGTYTPYTLVLMRDGNGWLIFSIVWMFALIGILTELLMTGRAVKVGQMFIYLGMGWAIAFDFDGLKAVIPAAGLWWLAAGGIAYTVGVIFYVLDKLNRLTHAHGIWHFFVLAGSACHFISLAAYVR
ncbi:MAG: hemolysin III family protein [Gammaproteobacteria bacterium]|nr:hemolysin III family protein [Gammaproteobacteria bacterium]